MKKITNVQAAGYSIVVELLTSMEAAGTNIVLTKEESQQAYIKSIGPLVAKDSGLQINQRVLLQGNYCPLPLRGENNRILGTVDMHNIKAIFDESDE